MKFMDFLDLHDVKFPSVVRLVDMASLETSGAMKPTLAKF